MQLGIGTLGTDNAAKDIVTKRKATMLHLDRWAPIEQSIFALLVDTSNRKGHSEKIRIGKFRPTENLL